MNRIVRNGISLPLRKSLELNDWRACGKIREKILWIMTAKWWKEIDFSITQRQHEWTQLCQFDELNGSSAVVTYLDETLEAHMNIYSLLLPPQFMLLSSIHPQMCYPHRHFYSKYKVQNVGKQEIRFVISTCFLFFSFFSLWTNNHFINFIRALTPNLYDKTVSYLMQLEIIITKWWH